MATEKDKRLWMRFPNDFPWHPKIVRLSVEAKWAFVEMNGYSRVRDLDGVIPAEEAEFEWTKPVLDELVASHPVRPLVQRQGETYVIRKYAMHQQTTADREKDSARASNAAKTRWDEYRKQQAFEEDARRMQDASDEDAVRMLGDAREQRLENRDIGNEVDGYVSSGIADANPRPEIDELLDLLDSEIRSNGGRVPSRTKKNRDAIRLLIDKDGIRPDQIARAIRWCQADEFWRANILSASKLREKYDQLRLAAQRTHPSTPKLARADENAAEFYRLYGGDDERAGSFQALDPGVG